MLLIYAVKFGECIGSEKEKDQLTIEIWISGDTGILLLMKGKLTITKVKSSRRFCLLSTSVVDFKVKVKVRSRLDYP